MSGDIKKMNLNKVIYAKSIYPTFYETVTNSPQWKLWESEQAKRLSELVRKGRSKSNFVYDMAEVMECGWISQKHFQDFLNFVINQTNT